MTTSGKVSIKHTRSGNTGSGHLVAHSLAVSMDSEDEVLSSRTIRSRKTEPGGPSATVASRPGCLLASQKYLASDDAIASMRKGIPAQIIPELAVELSLTQDALIKLLSLPASTIKSRLADHKMLNVLESDRVYRAIKIIERAADVLEDAGSAKAWVLRVNRALGGVAPLSLLDTQMGYDLVTDVLGRIEYGIVA